MSEISVRVRNTHKEVQIVQQDQEGSDQEWQNISQSVSEIQIQKRPSQERQTKNRNTIKSRRRRIIRRVGGFRIPQPVGARILEVPQIEQVEPNISSVEDQPQIVPEDAQSNTESRVPIFIRDLNIYLILEAISLLYSFTIIALGSIALPLRECETEMINFYLIASIASGLLGCIISIFILTRFPGNLVGFMFNLQKSSNYTDEQTLRLHLYWVASLVIKKEYRDIICGDKSQQIVLYVCGWITVFKNLNEPTCLLGQENTNFTWAVLFIILIIGFPSQGLTLIFGVLQIIILPFVYLKKCIVLLQNKKIQSQKYGQVLNDVVECVICLSKFKFDDDCIILNCSKFHFFHKVCLTEWSKVKQSCPLCKITF